MQLTIAHTWDGAELERDEQAELSLSGGGGDWRLELDAPYHGDPRPMQAPGPTPRLWEHEVVELFLVAPGAHYLEIELGPHGHHWVLELRGVRQIVRDGLPIEFDAAISGGRWRGRARVPGDLVPGDIARVNAFAMHGVGAARRYLAHHPLAGEAPDFHRIEGFPDWSAKT